MLDEKSTWELEFSVPRLVKNIGTSKLIGQNGEESEKEKEDTPEHDEEEEGSRQELSKTKIRILT